MQGFYNKISDIYIDINAPFHLVSLKKDRVKMGVIERTAPANGDDVIIEKKPSPKPERPKKHAVVMSHDTSMPIPCAVCILREVFQKSVGESHSLLIHAAATGKATVMISTKEIAQEKAEHGNAAAFGKGILCNPLVSKIGFRAEPL